MLLTVFEIRFISDIIVDLIDQRTILHDKSAKSCNIVLYLQNCFNFVLNF